MGTECVRPGGPCSVAAGLARFPMTRRTFRGLPLGRGSGAEGVRENLSKHDGRTDAKLFLAEANAALARPHLMSALVMRLSAREAGWGRQGALVRHGQPKRQLHGAGLSLSGSMCVGNLPFPDALSRFPKFSALPHVQ